MNILLKTFPVYLLLIVSVISLIFYLYPMPKDPEADTGFPERGGAGCRGYRYFILGHFVVGHIMWCTDKMSADKMSTDKILVDKMPVKIARGDKMLAILWDR